MLRSPPPRSTFTPSRTPTPRTSPRYTGSAAPSPPRSQRTRPTEATDRREKGRGAATPSATTEAAAKGHLRQHFVHARAKGQGGAVPPEFLSRAVTFFSLDKSVG